MRKLTFLLFLFAVTAAQAQNHKEDFTITLPEQKVPNSLYNTLRFVDVRHDTSHLGIVQLGAFNKKARVIPKMPLALQLTSVLQSLTDETAGEGELLFQLRQLSFAEITGATSERGYCYLRAALYARDGEHYRPVSAIDTVIYIKTMDVTRALFRRGSKTIADFIASGLAQPSSASARYTFDDVMHIDDLEKKQLKLYTATAYTDGLYSSYTSFRDQTPDAAATVEMKGDRIAVVKKEDGDGKWTKVKAKDVYALVHNGQVFVGTEYGYYPVQKTGNDFFFTGKAKVTANTGDVIAASLFFGIIGGLIASDADATFDMKIDHQNGGFIRLREVKAIR